MIVFVVLALTRVRGYIRAHFLTCSFHLIAHYLCIKIVSCFTFHRSLFPRPNSQSVSIGLGNGLMLHRRLARETSHCLSQFWPSLPTHIWVWWKCMVSYCWYHNGRTFIISCWRARKVYANYICYILGRSSSCLIFCNYYSRQNLTWRMWSYILSVNTVFNYPTKLHIAGRRVIWKTRSKRRHGKLYVYLKCDKRFIKLAD